MAEKVSAGQQDKAEAEARTAQVAAENKQEEQARQREARAAQQRQQQDRAAETPTEADERRAQLHEQLGKAESAADKFRQVQEAGDSDVAGQVALNPYPNYEDRSVDELRAAAEGRGVEINRDVEKAELVRVLRVQDPTNAGLDFMPLEELRSLAGEKGVEVGDEFLKAHLITELRAADSGVYNTGTTTR